MLRIIAGEKRGFNLLAPDGLTTRPTLGRVRESLFSILGPVLVDSVVWDLFAGAGALGFEALSRGAASCVFVENHRNALDALRANQMKLEYGSVSKIAGLTVSQFLEGEHTPPPNLVFLDAPYGYVGYGPVLTALEKHVSTVECLLVIQSGIKDVLQYSSAWTSVDERIYGKTRLWFLRRSLEIPAKLA